MFRNSSTIIENIMAQPQWITKAVSKMKKKGTVGAFRAQARKAGYSDTIAYARHVLANKSRYDTRTIRRAAFALNAYKATHGRK
jgi:hypothetical protein